MGAQADGQILYDFGTIADAGSAIDTAVSTMRNLLSQLESDLRALESGAWTSEAQAAYKIRKDKWHNASNHIAMILSQVKVSLENSANQMQATDRRASTYFPS